MSKLPWVECPTFDVDYDRAPDQRFADAPREILNLGQNLLSAMKADIPSGLWPLADAIRLRTANRFHKEITSLATLVEADWRDLMLANVSYDLVLSSFGCSTVALPGPDGPVVARNMDWWPEHVLAQSSCLMRYKNADGLVFANAGWPGAVGAVTGMSGRGFAIVLNAVTHEEGVNKTGYPVLLHIRRVLEDAKDFDAALKMLANTKLAAPALLTLVGSENSQRVVVERSPTKHALRWADDGPLVTTNDYRLLVKPPTPERCEAETSELYRTTCTRYEYLCQFFADHSSDQHIDDAKLLYALTDEHVIQGITAQHILMRPRTSDVKMFVPRHLLAT